jgi:hypothetical protein
MKQSTKSDMKTARNALLIFAAIAGTILVWCAGAYGWALLLDAIFGGLPLAGQILFGFFGAVAYIIGTIAATAYAIDTL